MKTKLLFAVTVLGVGCSSHESQPSTISGSAAPPTSAPKVVEPAQPAAPAKPAEAEPTGLTFAWPKGGTSTIVHKDGDTKLAWKTSSATGEINLPREVARGVVKDVTKDGEAELVIFAKPVAQQPEWFQDQTMTWIVGIGPNKQPARMWLLEGQVLGATDEASLDRELAATGLAQAKDSSAQKLIARLSLATPAELQALVGAPGLKLCKRQGEKRKCTTVAQKSIDAKRAAEIVKRAGVTAAFDPGDNDESYSSLQAPACNVDDKKPTRLDCSASVGGPAGGEWVFEKTASGLRLAEMWSWAEDS